MRLVVTRCEVTYSGRLSTVLPEATPLLMLKDHGFFLCTTMRAATSR